MTLYERLISEGKVEGKAEGKAEEREELLGQIKLRVRDSLAAQGIEVSVELREHIDACTELDTVLTWFRRSFGATSVADVFDH